MNGTKPYRLLDVSRRVNRSTSTIRNWERLGYILPATRDRSNQRRYDDHDVRLITEAAEPLRAEPK